MSNCRFHKRDVFKGLCDPYGLISQAPKIIVLGEFTISRVSDSYLEARETVEKYAIAMPIRDSYHPYYIYVENGVNSLKLVTTEEDVKAKRVFYIVMIRRSWFGFRN